MSVAFSISYGRRVHTLQDDIVIQNKRADTCMSIIVVGVTVNATDNYPMLSGVVLGR